MSNRRLYESADFPGESFTTADVRTITGVADAKVCACATKGIPFGGFLFTVAGIVDLASQASKRFTPTGTWRKATVAAGKRVEATPVLLFNDGMPINPRWFDGHFIAGGEGEVS